jgi:hypothetical protein
LVLPIAGRDVHFINFLFAIGLQFRAENSLTPGQSPMRRRCASFNKSHSKRARCF